MAADNTRVTGEVFNVGGLNIATNLALQDNAATPNAITLRVGGGEGGEHAGLDEETGRRDALL